MAEAQSVNIIAEMSGGFFCVFAMVVTLMVFHISRRIRNYILSIFACLFVMVSTDLTILIPSTAEFLLQTRLLYPIAFLKYGSTYLYPLLYIQFLLYLIQLNAQEDTLWMKQLAKRVAQGIFLAQFMVLCVSQFTGIIYYFDETGTLQRGRLYVLPLLFFLVYLVVDLFLLYRFWEHMSHYMIAFLCCCIAFTAFAVILQLYLRYFRFLCFSCMLSSMILLIFALRAQTGRYIDKEKKIAEMKAAMMVSQIQPHFLYNALVSIAQLCEKDPRTAKTAIITFSEYLRENMDSLKKQEPIPFAQELEHVKHYLFLEKMRFGDYLETELDIQTVAFKIPVLSLQPLVENAVRHGVGMREEGGKVTISTREREDCFEVCVIDNGVGFNSAQVSVHSGEHVGIQNVDQRLRAACNGTLTVVSTLGAGTTARIVIPKEGGSGENFGSGR